MAQSSNKDPAVRKTGFFDLPPELREQIYRYVLPVTVNLSVPTRVREYRRCHRISLLLACRTIHIEAAPPYYRETVFVSKWFDEVERFLRTLIAAKCAWLRDLYLPLPFYLYMTYDDRAESLEWREERLKSYGLEVRKGVFKTNFFVDGKEVWATKKPFGSI